MYLVAKVVKSLNEWTYRSPIVCVQISPMQWTFYCGFSCRISKYWGCQLPGGGPWFSSLVSHTDSSSVAATEINNRFRVIKVSRKIIHSFSPSLYLHSQLSSRLYGQQLKASTGILLPLVKLRGSVSRLSRMPLLQLIMPASLTGIPCIHLHQYLRGRDLVLV